MEQCDVLVIGAGVIGISIARRLALSGREVVLSEKEPSFGRHTSSRNSEVIHSGIYYKNGSLKARLCVEGRRLMYDYLAAKGIPYRRCGKYVVACSEDEVERVEALKANGERNGVEGLELVDGGRIAAELPMIKVPMGLFAPCTGLLDVHLFMASLLADAEAAGAVAVFGLGVVRLEKSAAPRRWTATLSDGEKLAADVVVNAAGLDCDQVAGLAGIDIDAAGYRLHWCKGEYFKTTRYKNLARLVYPVPDPNGHSLGIHTRLHLDGTLAFGPNAYYVDALSYGMDDSRRADFHRAAVRYMPELNAEDLTPFDTGIRPKIQGPGEPEKDFVIREESGRGLPGLVNLIGIESPGLTACLAIAGLVEGMAG